MNYTNFFDSSPVGVRVRGPAYPTQEEIEERQRQRIQLVKEKLQYIARISPQRLATVKEPDRVCCTRFKCFALFRDGKKPRDIPRIRGISRKTLYIYYEDYKVLSALRILRANSDILQAMCPNFPMHLLEIR